MKEPSAAGGPAATRAIASALLALAVLAPPAGAAAGSSRTTVSPLPASDYSVRPVCPARERAGARCTALELVPEAAAARARAAPLGLSLTVARAASEVCTPPTAAEGCYGLRPQDLHAAYALPNASVSASTQTVALVDAFNDLSAERDLRNYDEVFGLPRCTTANGCFREINQRGAASSPPFPRTLKELREARKGSPAKREEAEEASGWALEISLDLQLTRAICESCDILLVEADSSENADMEQAEDTAALEGANEISNSWWFEAEPDSDSAAFDHPGTVITAAAGDGGYRNWDAPEAGERGHVDYPASSPHVVAVGGTRLRLNSNGGTYESEVAWDGDGASGGGCSERFAAPPWQQEVPDWGSVGCGSARAVADVSADADPYSGVAVYDSSPDEQGVVRYWVTLGGTSLSSPLIASTFALAGGAGGVEYPARTLYENELVNPASLHDVASGSNGPCSQPLETEGLYDCTALEEAAGCEYQPICMAGPGYDGPTGVGSPDGVGAFEPTGAPERKPQLIAFTSSAPAAAVVGGPEYAPTASASSGLPVSFSTATPETCTVVSASVAFVGAGTCTIDANQAGNGEYRRAAQVQQSFAVGPAPLAPLVPAASSALGFRSSSPAAPTSSFTLVGAPSINRSTGALTFTAEVANAGTLMWTLTFANGSFGVVQSRAGCRTGQIRLRGACRPGQLAFGSGRVVVSSAGTVRFTVRPSAAATAGLRRARKRGRRLLITATLTFRSSGGGSPVSRSESIADRLARAGSR